MVLAALGALLWVAFGNNSTSDVTEAATTDTAPSAPADATDPTDDPTTSSSSNDTTTDLAMAPGVTEPAETSEEPSDPDPAPPPEPATDAPENFGPRMELVELDGWLNTSATSLDEFDGQVLLVEMWTFGCHNCKARIPYNQGYYEEFADENFEIIGVHAPEFGYEADVANIENALVDLGVTWPVALDTDKKNFRAWQPGSTNYWPRTYVIDQNGDIRYDHIGEGKYEELRETIRYLVENPPPPVTS